MDPIEAWKCLGCTALTIQTETGAPPPEPCRWCGEDRWHQVELHPPRTRETQ